MLNLYKLKTILIVGMGLLVFFQTIYIDSNYYSSNKRVFCTCNHNSKKEIHLTSKATNCHDSIKQSRHICSCKKLKNQSEIINQLKQIKFSIAQFTILKPNLKTLYYFSPSLTHQNYNYVYKLIKPPRF
jgi:hypothetical protein